MLAQKRKIDDTEGDDHQNGSNGTMVDNGNMKLPHVAGVLRVCDELRTDLQTRKRIRSQDEAPESKQRTVVPMETSLRFLELLQLQRAAYTHTRSTKQVTSEEKLSMDKLNLDYQNVIYEIRHLEKEIAACEDIETEYQKIELISEEEFEKAHPEAPTDPHAKMLARLNHELEERESLVKQGEELTKELNEAKDENDTALQELETLDAELSEALKSTIPLQKRLGVRATAKREQLERAKLLPDPLFVLYKTSIGYMEAMDNTDMEVDIIGDAELAVDFTSRTPLAPVADQKPSSADEMEVDQPADNEGAGSKDHADHSSTLYRRHPLSIQWSLKDGLSQDAVAKVSFSYLTSLEIVVVSTEVLQTLEHIPGTLLGMGIMAGDTGTDSPNPSNAYQQSASTPFIFDTTSAGGHAYSWAQDICGLQYPTKSTQRGYLPKLVPLLQMRLQQLRSLNTNVCRLLEGSSGKLESVQLTDGQHEKGCRYEITIAKGETNEQVELFLSPPSHDIEVQLVM